MTESTTPKKPKTPEVNDPSENEEILAPGAKKSGGEIDEPDDLVKTFDDERAPNVPDMVNADKGPAKDLGRK